MKTNFHKFNLLLFLILYSTSNKTWQCQFGDEICECTDTQMICLELSKTITPLLDMDLLSFENSINTTIIQNKNVTTIRSSKSLTISSLTLINNEINYLISN